MDRALRLAWFSPLPPDATGIAAYSAELLSRLDDGFTIERFPEARAHEFAWRHRRAPYDLVVYQLGNAPWHDYMWAYLASYPGLVVLHDVRLHHARARHLLNAGRVDDYRREFAWNHPEASGAFAEYAVAGLGGPIYYLWRMVRTVVRTARGVAVHNARVAADLCDELPGARVDVVRMGVPEVPVDEAASAAARAKLGLPADAVLFVAFGKVTPEKRIAPVLHAMASIASAHLLLVGDASGYGSLAAEIAASGVGDRVHATGAVPDAELGRYLGAADLCLCLRWPTADETSASWLRCLAAGRATVVSDLPHLVDVPTILARGWRDSHASAAPVAVAIDLLEEDESLRTAMTRLAADTALRGEIAAAGHAYWREHHRLELMADDYRALIDDVARRPAPHVADLPPHFTDDYSSRARDIASKFGLDLAILRQP